jgi:hypothetical protein
MSAFDPRLTAGGLIEWSQTEVKKRNEAQRKRSWPVVPRFYFHLRNDFDVPDDEGKELRDLEAALEHAANEARKLAGEMLKETGRITLRHRIDIEDERHEIVRSVAIRDVVRVEA